MTSSSPGWFSDPGNPQVSRYWTGAQWAGERIWNGAAWIDSRPPALPPQPVYAGPGAAPFTATATRTPAIGPVRNRLLLTVAGAVLVVIGSVLPWATQNNGITTTTINGSSVGGGQFLIIVGLAIAVLAGLYLSGVIGKRSCIASLVLGALAITICFANMANISDVMDKEKANDPTFQLNGGGTHSGIGLFVVLIGCVLVLVATIMTMRSARVRRAM